MQRQLCFAPEVLHIRPWPDDVIDHMGHDPRSTYVEDYWLGLLGPSTTWLLRRLAAGFEYSPEGFDLDLAETARSLGLGDRSGRHSPFVRSINRTVQFGLALLSGPEEFSVRRRLPPAQPGPARPAFASIPGPPRGVAGRAIASPSRRAAATPGARNWPCLCSTWERDMTPRSASCFGGVTRPTLPGRRPPGRARRGAPGCWAGGRQDEGPGGHTQTADAMGRSPTWTAPEGPDLTARPCCLRLLPWPTLCLVPGSGPAAYHSPFK